MAMTSQEWSVAVQRELDSLQRSVDARFSDFSSRLDKLLSQIEYSADKRSLDIRFTNINEKIDDTETDVDKLKDEIRNSVNALRTDLLAERARYERAIAREADDRKKSHEDYLKARQSQFRWLVSMVMIPITIAIVTLWTSKN